MVRAVEMVTCANCGVSASVLDSQCSSCGGSLHSPSIGLETTQPSTRQHTLAGKRLSHYQVQERLGAGGMGVVYRAMDVNLGRLVALKVLAPHLSDDERAKARFVREARTTSALDHLNIGTIHEIGEEGGTLFIAMALYEGETLKQRLERGPIPAAEAIPILRQMASGLAAAHAAGIVHRDIKPGNVMLTRKGSVKLLDFGLAKLVVDRQKITFEGETVGTLVYTAPEQLRGERVDHRADLWALGVVAYEMLSGASPFWGESPAATTKRILSHEPPPLISVPGVPHALSTAVSRLLEKGLAGRIQSAEEVISALSASTTRQTLVQRIPRRRAYLFAAVAAIAGACLAVAATIAVSTGYWPKRSPKAPAALAKPPATQEATQRPAVKDPPPAERQPPPPSDGRVLKPVQQPSSKERVPKPVQQPSSEERVPKPVPQPTSDKRVSKPVRQPSSDERVPKPVRQPSSDERVPKPVRQPPQNAKPKTTEPAADGPKPLERSRIELQ